MKKKVYDNDDDVYNVEEGTRGNEECYNYATIKIEQRIASEILIESKTKRTVRIALIIIHIMRKVTMMMIPKITGKNCYADVKYDKATDD